MQQLEQEPVIMQQSTIPTINGTDDVELLQLLPKIGRISTSQWKHNDTNSRSSSLLWKNNYKENIKATAWSQHLVLLTATIYLIPRLLLTNISLTSSFKLSILIKMLYQRLVSWVLTSHSNKIRVPSKDDSSQHQTKSTQVPNPSCLWFKGNQATNPNNLDEEKLGKRTRL